MKSYFWGDIVSLLKELRTILDNIYGEYKSKQSAILTITEVKGSAYRQPGAKMLMNVDGDIHGILSGGCLESDLLEWAKDAMTQKKSLICKYDLSEDELWGLGIGCKGSLEIFIDPIDIHDDFWKKTYEFVNKDQMITLIHELPEGKRVGFDINIETWGDINEIPTYVLETAASKMKHRTRAETVTSLNRRFVIDTIRPNEKLIIAGAGHDAVPLAKLASQVGFDVTILDQRSSVNHEDRFPTASHLLMKNIESYEQNKIENSWWVIMNHHKSHDADCVKLAMNSKPAFIGMLGPLSRTNEILQNINASLDSGPIHAPIGLDLGAETIDEVAVSIISELMAKRSGRSALSLHGKSKIHAYM